MRAPSFVVPLALTLASFAVLAVLAPSAAEARRRVIYRPVVVRGHAHVHVRYGYRERYAPGGAVSYGPSGFYLGAGVLGLKILDQRGGPEALEDGVGLALFGGFRLNERVSLELGWMGSFHNPATIDTGVGRETDYLVLEGVTGDLRVHLERAGNLDPFVQAGVGFYALGSDHLGLDALGSGFQVGAGFDYFLSDYVTLGLRVRYHGIAMSASERSSDDDVFISAAAVEASLGLHF